MRCHCDTSSENQKYHSEKSFEVIERYPDYETAVPEIKLRSQPCFPQLFGRTCCGLSRRSVVKHFISWGVVSQQRTKACDWLREGGSWDTTAFSDWSKSVKFSRAVSSRCDTDKTSMINLEKFSMVEWWNEGNSVCYFDSIRSITSVLIIKYMWTMPTG